MTDAPPRLFRFDPTIHAGHVITAATIVVCAVGSWYSLQGDITQLKLADVTQARRMDGIEQQERENRAETDRKIEALVRDNNQTLGKLRDDMNAWFMALNDKLDRKADKR